MKRIKGVLAVSTGIAMAAGALSASANTGTITFQGLVTSTTCNAQVHGPGAVGNSSDATIVLPTVSQAAFSAIGDTAGDQLLLDHPLALAALAIALGTRSIHLSDSAGGRGALASSRSAASRSAASWPAASRSTRSWPASDAIARRGHWPSRTSAPAPDGW